MEKKSKGEGSSTEPSSLKKICIREYAAEVRRKDMKKCCPFNRSDGSKESDDHLAEMVFASLLQDSNGAKAQNITKDASAAANLNMVINDVANCQEGPSSQPLASIESDTECQIEESFAEDPTDAENDRRPRRDLARRKPQKRRLLSEIYKDLGFCINGGNEGNVDDKSPTGTKNCCGDIASDTFIRNKKRTRATSKNGGVLKDERETPRVVEPKLDRAKSSEPVSKEAKDVNANRQEGPSLQPLASLELDAECQNEGNFATVAENDRPRRNLAREKPQKYRLLSEIYEELGSCVYGGSEGNVDTESYSDDVTLAEFIRNKKRARTTSKNSGASKNIERKTPRVAERAKTSKPVSNNSLGNDSSDLGFRYNLRKIRSTKVDLHTTEKPQKSSLCVTQKAKGVSKLRDGNQKRFTEEGSCSRPAHGAKSAQLAMPTTGAISNKNTETLQDDLSDDDDDDASMAALQLLRLFNSGVDTKTSSYKTATGDRALEPKSPCGLDGVVRPSSGSTACEFPVEVNMITGVNLPQAEQNGSGTYICLMSRNPAEFSIPEAKSFMRRV